MLHGSLYSPALCLGPNLALTFGPDFSPHHLPLAPNLYLLTKAPNFCLLVLTPNLYFAALTPYLYLQTLAPNFYLPVLANNFIIGLGAWISIYLIIGSSSSSSGSSDSSSNFFGIDNVNISMPILVK